MSKPLKYLISGFFLVSLIISQAGIVFLQTPCHDEKKDPPIPSLPSSQTADEELRFIAFGDSGRGCKKFPVQCRLADQMAAIQSTTKFKLAVLLGDNIYQTGKPKNFRPRFYDPYKSLYENDVVFRGVLGNHDLRNSEGSDLQIKFFSANDAQEQRNIAANIPEDVPEQITYYSFQEKSNLVEFFALDSTLISGDFPQWIFFKRKKYRDNALAEQLKWFQEKLEQSKATWKIVLVHHPLYSSAARHGVTHVNKDGHEITDEKKYLIPDEIKAMREGIESLLIKHKVRLVIAGHDHNTEEIKPQNGIWHFVTGGGSELRSDGFNTTGRKPYPRLPEFHRCGTSTLNSFMLFSVSPQEIRFWMIGVNGKPFNYGVIPKTLS